MRSLIRPNLWLTGLLLSFTTLILAQTQNLAVEDAVSIALKNNLNIKQAGNDLIIARADLQAAYADLFMPVFQLTGSYTNSNSGFSSSLAPSFFSPYNDSYSVDFQVQRTIFAGGKYWFTKESKRSAAELAVYMFKDQTSVVSRTTRIDFYSLLLQKEKLRVALDNDKNLVEHMNSTRFKYENGLASQLDYLKDQVKYKNNKPQVAQAQNAYELGKINFANSIGLPSSVSIEPVGELTDVLNIKPKMTDETQITEIALQQDLTIRTADYNIIANIFSRNVIASALLPTVSGSFTYNYSTRIMSISPPVRSFLPGWSFTLSTVIPLDAWIPYISNISNKLQAADELTKRLQYQKAQTSDALKIRVKTLLLNIKYAQQNVASQQDTVTHAKVALATARKEYREGSISSLDLSDSEVSYNQAVTNYLQALYDSYTNILELNSLIEE